VHSSNLCTEITLNTSKEETAVCNLGSVNLGKHIVGGKLDEELLKNTIGTAMRMLDNVIDINFYPTIEARNSNMKHRPVGLGIMGFQDALFMLDINFDSEEAVRFADESMESIAYHSILASSELAKERGAYETFKGSKWDRGILPADTIKLLEKERKVPIEISANGKKDWSKVRESIRKHGMRNSNCMAIAPTATISNISGCFPSIEPMYNNLYVKSNMSGEFTIVNMYLVEDLKSEGMWNPTVMEDIKRHDGSLQQITYIPKKIRDKYKSAFEIDPEWLIKAAGYRGKWIDQSQSLNIFTATTSGKKLSELYAYAWRMGLKTTYYLRTMGASSIEKSTVDINKMKSKTGDTIAISMVTESGKARAMAAIEKAQAVVDVQDVITEAVKATSPACPVGMTEEERENCEACQ
jgi:ribonucleoside-diphosphate reductase alpha chain